MRGTTTLKFYFNHTKQQVWRHKCNSCLGICSIFIVVIISALCYTLVEDTPVVFYRQSEQEYGQYDLIIAPNAAPFLNYSLVSLLLENDNNLQYHSPRIVWNETGSLIYPSECDVFFKNNHNRDCSISLFIDNDTLCDKDTIQSASIWLIDFTKEKRMEFGRSFDDKYIPNYGEVILSRSTANRLEIDDDDIDEMIYISLPLNSSIIPLLSNYLNDNYYPNKNISIESPEILQLIDECNSVIIPLNLSFISEDSLGGKFAEKSHKFDAVINMEYFMEMFFENLPLTISNRINGLDNNGYIKYESDTIYQYVNKIYMNLPPNRITAYMSTDYRVTLSNLVNFAGKIRYLIGWNQVYMELDILESMSLVSYTVLSLSIVLDMIIFVLIILSVGLLYSLLVISIDSKKFMLGILRMLGMNKKSLVYLLICQALGYSIPAYITGILLAQLGTIYFSRVLGSAGNVKLDAKLSNIAIIISTVVGIGCSLIAAILPIISALQENLREVLDIRHSATKAVKFSINRSNNFASFSWNIIIICSVLSFIGWYIYYFLPQAFLSGDLSKLSIMLFILMLLMLFGFVLIGINMQHIMERIMVKLILFWEKRPIPNIVIKNLIAHRIRNRKTGIMYSLSLSFVFLVTVLVNSNIQYMKVSHLKWNGAKLSCSVSHDIYRESAGCAVLEDFLSGTGNYSNLNRNQSIHQYIDDFAWRSYSIRKNHHGTTRYFKQAHITNIGKYFSSDAMLFGAASNYESMAPQQFIKSENGYSTSLTGTEQLYTASGSQRAMIGISTSDFLKLKDLNDKFLLKFTDGDHDTSDNVYFMFKSMGWYGLYPHYGLQEKMHRIHSNNDVLIAHSSVPRLFDGIESVEDMWIYRVFIKLKSNVINSEIEFIKNKLNKYCYHIWDYKVFSSQIEDSVTMLDMIFSMNTYMALFLCLFSLIASMSTNIIEQTKEIGIFQSMGLTKYEINKIYIYEALILILSSSFIGMIIGSILCFVVLQQQQLFTNYPVDFYVPQSVIGACITGAVITSVLSVWLPLKNLNKRQIAQSLRQVL